MAAEILYILQQRDELGFSVSPPRIRRLVEQARCRNSLLDVPPVHADDLGKTQRSFNTVLKTLRYELTEADPLDQDYWGPAELAILPTRRRATMHKVLVCDWSTIQCLWLREMGKSWARTTQPYREDINNTIRALRHASDAIVGRPAFKDKSRAGFAEAKRINDYIYTLKDKNGAQYHTSTACKFMTDIRSVVGFLRAAGEIDDVPSAFAFSAVRAPSKTETNADDELGRSLPLSLLDFLEDNLAAFATDYAPGFLPIGWTNENYGSMLSAIYLLLRDTGRRNHPDVA